MHLTHSEDDEFITHLFPAEYRSLIPAFIDERAPELKRTEFNRMRKHLFSFLCRTDSMVCQLRSDVCDPSAGFEVDHLIPLSSNLLNKQLREMKAEPGRKVATQSFGSNNPLNLILACRACNARKKHHFVSRELLRTIIARKLGTGPAAPSI